MDYSGRLKDMDLLLREGRLAEVRGILAKLKPSTVASKHRLMIADIARRAGLPNFLIRLLRAVVRPKFGRSRATEDECALYASGLTRIGAFHEAEELLSPLIGKPQKSQTWFIAGQLEMITWNYSAAIPLLRKYVNSPMTAPYQRLVGGLNLAACHIAEGRLDESEAALEEVLTSRASKIPSMMRGNIAELSAQIAIQRRDFETARRFLDEACQQLRFARQDYRAFVEKWQVLIDLLKNGPTPEQMKSLLVFQARASQMGEYEIARDCDLYMAKATGDDEMFLRLYYGTRFPAYRRRLLANQPDKITLVSQEQFTLTWGRAPGPSTVLIDPRLRTVSLADKGLRLSLLESRLIDILLSDRYRPLRYGEVVSALYPGEYFDPETTIAKGFQIIDRVRRFLVSHNIPLSIQIRKGQVRLVGDMSAPVNYRIWVKDPEFLENDYWPKLRNYFKDSAFSSREVAASLNLSQRQARRLIHRAVDAEEIVSLKPGRGATYCFKKKVA